MKPLFFFLFYFFALSAKENFEPSIGSTIHSDHASYRLQDKLGEGAFGKVFEAIDKSGHLYAIKWYKYVPFYSGHYNDNKREYARGQALKNPHIIQSIETFMERPEEGAYTVLEFVPGKTLGQIEKKSLSLNQAVSLSCELVESLRYAYCAGYLHLDLHGNNVMQHEDGHLKIIDLASFFSFEELQNIKKTVITTTVTSKILNFIAKHPKLMAPFSQEAFFSLESFFVCNFDDIIELVIKFFLRTPLARDQKIDLRTQLKNLSWNCEEDFEEGKFITFEDYLNEILAHIMIFHTGEML